MNQKTINKLYVCWISWILAILMSVTVADANDTIRVGVYEYEPYFMVDDDGTMRGYYYDLFELFQTMDPFEYTFVVGTIEEGRDRLKEGTIDLLLGVPIGSFQEDSIVFNRHRTNKEVFGIFAKEEFRLENLHGESSFTLGMVEGDFNTHLILDVIRSFDVPIDVVYMKDYKQLLAGMESGMLDLMVHNKSTSHGYHLIYEFIGRDVFIAARKEKGEVILRIDRMIERMGDDHNAIQQLIDQYFGSKQSSFQRIFVAISLVLIGAFACYLILRLRKRWVRFKIQFRIRQERYLLEYQPIYDPKTNRIMAFEGLLRQYGKHNQLISPMKFIPEIEHSGMLGELSVWMIGRVLKDYVTMKSYDNLSDHDFYVSINVSIHEIADRNFVDQVIAILNESDVGENRVCLEIIERFRTDRIDTIAEHIQILKRAGFKIAIDDFGVEYSNLDIFHKLNVDVVKVDKSFVDGIGQDELMDEVVLFISKLAKLRNQTVVFEGVEQKEQVVKINSMEQEQLYVQGFYYNRPMRLEQLQTIPEILE